MTRAGFWNDSFDCLYDSSDNFKSFKKASKECKRVSRELQKSYMRA